MKTFNNSRDKLHSLLTRYDKVKKYTVTSNVLANISRSRYNTPQYGRNGTAHAAGASILSPARGVFAGMRMVCVCAVCGMRAACGGPGELPLGSATHFYNITIATQPVHRLQIRPIVHN